MTTWALFECVFYKFAAPCGWLSDRSCGHFGSQPGSYQRNRRGSAICKKRFQKCGVSPCILINIFSYFLSDSYNGTLFKSLHSVYVKWYWLISFRFVNRRSMEFVFRTSIFFYVFMNTRYISVIQLQFN